MSTTHDEEDSENMSGEEEEKKALIEPEDSRDKLTKNITVVRGVSVVLCSVIGTGIFITPNLVAKSLNAPATGILVWFAGGLISLVGGLTYAELAGIIPKSGSEVTYLKHIYGPLPSFLSVFLMHFFMGGLKGSITALTFVEYFWNIFFDDPSQTVPSYCSVLLGVFIVGAIISVTVTQPTLAVRTIVFWTVLKVIALIMIIVIGLVSLGRGNTKNIAPGFSRTSVNVWEWNSAWSGVVFTYFGWQNICCIASEVENPQRNIPIILIVSISIVTLLYCLTVASFYIILPHHLIISPSIEVASEFGAITFGAWGRIVISGAVAVSAFGTLSVTLLGFSRILHAGAAEGVLPEVFALVSKRFKTPLVSILYLGLTVVIYNLVGDVERFIGLATFIDFPFYVLCAVGVFVLRKTDPDAHRPYKVPLIIPGIFIVFGVYMFVLPFLGETGFQSCVIVFVSLLGVPIYHVFVADCFRWTLLRRFMVNVRDYVARVCDCD